MAEHFWTCQRQTNGVPCKFVNPKRRQICQRCGKRRPKTKQPAHMDVMKRLSYQACVELYGEKCGICGALPPPGKKLHRDHDHRRGVMRGLLCVGCNKTLNSRVDNVEWLRNAAAYIERSL